MKWLVLLAVLAVAYLLWRNARIERQAPPPPAAPPPAGEPLAMVRCAVCAVHLPRSEAIAGPDHQLFCSQEHRLKGGSGST